MVGHNNGKILGVLNSEGHAYQHAVIKETERLFAEGKSPFLFETAEFPVSLNGRHTRTDAVLRHKDRGLYLVGECKRTRPGTAWAFVKAPYVRYNYDCGEILFESLMVDENKGCWVKSHSKHGEEEKLFQIAYPFKDAQGEENAGSVDRDSIENAVRQVFLATHGLLCTIADHDHLIPWNEFVPFIPVVFTTARLYTLAADLEKTDLISGKLSAEGVNAVSRCWLLYRYHLSPDLVVRMNRRLSQTEQVLGLNLPRLLDHEYARTVAIVNSEGIEDFLLFASREL